MYWQYLSPCPPHQDLEFPRAPCDNFMTSHKLMRAQQWLPLNFLRINSIFWYSHNGKWKKESSRDFSLFFPLTNEFSVSRTTSTTRKPACKWKSWHSIVDLWFLVQEVAPCRTLTHFSLITLATWGTWIVAAPNSLLKIFSLNVERSLDARWLTRWVLFVVCSFNYVLLVRSAGRLCRSYTIKAYFICKFTTCSFVEGCLYLSTSPLDVFD